MVTDLFQLQQVFWRKQQQRSAYPCCLSTVWVYFLNKAGRDEQNGLETKITKNNLCFFNQKYVLFKEG